MRDGQWLAVGWQWVFRREKVTSCSAFILAFCPATDVDGPPSLLVVIDDVGSGVVGLLVIGKGGFESGGLAVDRDGEVGEDEIPIARSAPAPSLERDLSGRRVRSRSAQRRS